MLKDKRNTELKGYKETEGQCKHARGERSGGLTKDKDLNKICSNDL